MSISTLLHNLLCLIQSSTRSKHFLLPAFCSLFFLWNFFWSFWLMTVHLFCMWVPFPVSGFPTVRMARSDTAVYSGENCNFFGIRGLPQLGTDDTRGKLLFSQPTAQFQCLVQSAVFLLKWRDAVASGSYRGVISPYALTGCNVPHESCSTALYMSLGTDDFLWGHDWDFYLLIAEICAPLLSFAVKRFGAGDPQDSTTTACFCTKTRSARLFGSELQSSLHQLHCNNCSGKCV